MFTVECSNRRCAIMPKCHTQSSQGAVVGLWNERSDAGAMIEIRGILGGGK